MQFLTQHVQLSLGVPGVVCCERVDGAGLRLPSWTSQFKCWYMHIYIYLKKQPNKTTHTCVFSGGLGASHLHMCSTVPSGSSDRSCSWRGSPRWCTSSRSREKSPERRSWGSRRPPLRSPPSPGAPSCRRLGVDLRMRRSWQKHRRSQFKSWWTRAAPWTVWSHDPGRDEHSPVREGLFWWCAQFYARQTWVISSFGTQSEENRSTFLLQMVFLTIKIHSKSAPI